MLKQEIENEMWHAEHDTDQQFEDRLLAGEITWFEPYLNITSKTSETLALARTRWHSMDLPWTKSSVCERLHAT